MLLTEIMDKLAGEAILLEPGNLQACGKMLTLLDLITHPAIEQEKEMLKEHLESLILSDIEHGTPDINEIITIVETMQKILRNAAMNTKDIAEETTADTIMDMPDTKIEQVPKKEKQRGKKQQKEKEPVPFISEENFGEDVDLLMDFCSEAREHLDSIELNMLEWEKSPGDKEIINSIFRPFHTIKGVAGFLNLTKINHLSHQLENLLDEARDGRIGLSPELSDLIFDGVDILKSMISSHEVSLQAKQPVAYTVDCDQLIQRVTMFLYTITQAKETVTIEDIDQPHPKIGELLLEGGKISQEDLMESLERQEESEPKKYIGEMLITDKKVSSRDVRDAIRKQVESVKTGEDKYIKVDTTKMDYLLNMVGELVISQSMVANNPEVARITDQRFVRDLSQLARVTSTLQTISMSMRLVPIGATFQKMNRIVRDLAKKSSKKINLILEGQAAEIDRNMVEELYEPLVHMIRNSCDHGIGTPDQRRENGKSEEGTILLKAEHAGGKIIITISDDGEGLDREVIVAKAREKGLIGKDEMPDNKTIDSLILLPGFSTAKQITDVSGRGVGMDVVKKTIEKLHGNTDISSEKGKGCTFTIKLPLTTAIIDGMLVNVCNERYIIPTLNVKQLVHPKAEDITTIVGKYKTIMVRGNLIPFISLSEILGIGGETTNGKDIVVVIVEDGGRDIALQVDAVIGKQEIVIKNIEETYTSSKGVAGGAILGDGRVGLILDIRNIIETNVGSIGS